ncbi:orotidine-5'-phosphate decarboxylase [Weissella oryzae SG25]|uniref:Orotidine 5'-phosphate decarboxylase n=1 Tax=Weissella oryzae (strain DSM 25784 / JCM 18191 / LMG 30913 / SG25) TaxID=1329250 RepID=A0A069D0Q6_WEIOS|nr:orotidine-5'-phosphate decarboxylase [Weissella oryzae]GAK30906.1 orotidine-5'-phosphate decarboxylase [Weissella oryzae SG25]
MKAPIFIALDFANANLMTQFLNQFANVDEQPAVKVGMELFYQAGPVLIDQLHAQGITDIFLDLKLYDIPNTVEAAARDMGRLGVTYFTVHAAGGQKMLEAAQRGAQAGAQEAGHPTPHVLAVTQLTSFGEAELIATQQLAVSLLDSVKHLAQLADVAGVAGTISSAHEAQAIQTLTREGFETITPGIRLAGDDANDQARVMTPGKAAQMGATGLVVGRSITQALDPVAAYERVIQEFSEGI